jgi:hypothetical protein
MGGSRVQARIMAYTFCHVRFGTKQTLELKFAD